MKFVKPPHTVTIPTNNWSIENYIYQTKVDLSSMLPQIFKSPKNLSIKQHKSLKLLRQTKHLTIKPADKNLGLVILNTENYVDQIIVHLASDTYNMVEQFPPTLITSLENIIISFKAELTGYSNHLYNYLLPKKNYRIPRFYGLPKLHKNFSETGVPPLRPIVSHAISLLLHSSQFVDHVLQPIAQSYEDYLHNSSTLVSKISCIQIPQDATLVCLDVISLFPSIPQLECLNIIYQELHKHSELLIFDPNLIMQLLLFNIQNNYFEFANIIFHQIKGTAMGAAFSPTIANIYMSVFLKRFFITFPQYQPILLTRYIDDIFIIWPKTNNLVPFLEDLNSYHPNIKFTMTASTSTIDFLDLTIYKSNPSITQTLSIKTFQKPNNLYQYLHFSSNHPLSTYKGIVIGECIRYLRTNTNESNFLTQIELFKARLRNRGYPTKFIQLYTSQITFNKRDEYTNKQLQLQPHSVAKKPILKCVPPPNFTMLQEVILKKKKKIASHS